MIIGREDSEKSWFEKKYIYILNYIICRSFETNYIYRILLFLNKYHLVDFCIITFNSNSIYNLKIQSIYNIYGNIFSGCKHRRYIFVNI